MSTPAPTISTLRCRGCEYDLIGRTSGACPECGAPVAPAIAHARWWTVDRLDSLRAALWFVLVALLWPFGALFLLFILAFLEVREELAFKALICIALVTELALWSGSLAMCARAIAPRGSAMPALAGAMIAVYVLSGLAILHMIVTEPNRPTTLHAVSILTFAISWYGVVAWCGGCTILALAAHRPSRIAARATLYILLPIAGLLWITAALHMVAASVWGFTPVPDKYAIAHVLGTIGVAVCSSIFLAVVIVRLMRFIPRGSAPLPAATPPTSFETR
ncbi:MAG: hypothetical protein JNM94_07300 [Phycisphaerae bacterium]|nr:hypothetical protein [Phycisphaerae bacterium]